MLHTATSRDQDRSGVSGSRLQPQLMAQPSAPQPFQPSPNEFKAHGTTHAGLGGPMCLKAAFSFIKDCHRAGLLYTGTGKQ